MGFPVFNDSVRFADQPQAAAAVLCRTEHGNFHLGISYKRAFGPPNFLHLGFQDYLSTEWNWRFLWATADVEPERLDPVAGWCRLIWNRFLETGQLPYGIGWDGATFDSTGRLMLKSGEVGLTCSTFVLSVFLNAGIKVVEQSTWPVRPEDDAKFVDSLASFASPDILASLRREISSGAIRIWPAEVMAAFACTIPAHFDSARRRAEDLAADLDLLRP